MENMTTEKLREEVIEELEENGKYLRQIIENEILTEEQTIKYKFLIVLVYKEILKCYYDNDINQFTYSYEGEISIREVIEDFLAKESIDELELKLFSEENNVENCEEIFDEIVLELEENGYYEISASPDEDEDYNIKMLILITLHNDGLLDISFCAEHSEFTFTEVDFEEEDEEYEFSPLDNKFSKRNNIIH